jgi:hypothetical protein
MSMTSKRFKVIKEFRGPYVVLDLGPDYPAQSAKPVGSFTSKRAAEAFAAEKSA